ncbi:hypothetical protein F6V25_07900 [Oryzomonas japonica]|uniref:Uncharacterized protein n=1 Tax=Oryzomonas japonica TaxID=2603858 RepID=A0A7J4ZRB9_9BACT|nr:hypothetical protein [Oryzomonas japonica]KAB0665636.1 hypothetical protein F6V25_07900 [Oryzomonas japonica]
MNCSIGQAAHLVGGLLLERAPQAMLLPDSQLEGYYQAALQSFIGIMKQSGTEFEPPEDFKEKVMDQVRRYLDYKGKRFNL